MKLEKTISHGGRLTNILGRRGEKRKESPKSSQG